MKKNPNIFDISILYIKLVSLFNKNDETIFFSSSKMISQQNLIIYIENLINFFVEKIVLPVIVHSNLYITNLNIVNFTI